MSNPNGAKGSTAERHVATYLNGQRILADRKVKTGGKDTGDIWMPLIPGVVIEVKNHARMELAEWVDEAVVERRNAGADVGVVWHKRRGKGSPGEWFVTMTGEDFVTLLKHGISSAPLDDDDPSLHLVAGQMVTFKGVTYYAPPL